MVYSFFLLLTFDEIGLLYYKLSFFVFLIGLERLHLQLIHHRTKHSYVRPPDYSFTFDAIHINNNMLARHHLLFTLGTNKYVYALVEEECFTCFALKFLRHQVRVQTNVRFAHLTAVDHLFSRLLCVSTHGRAP